MQKTKTWTGRVTVKNADAGEVEAVFATLNVKDKDGDVIESGAIPDGSPVVISPYGHKVWSGAPPVGIGTIHEVDNEAVVRAKYFMETDAGRNDFYTVKGLAEAGLGEWSFGLLNIESVKTTKNGVNANYISSGQASTLARWSPRARPTPTRISRVSHSPSTWRRSWPT